MTYEIHDSLKKISAWITTNQNKTDFENNDSYMHHAMEIANHTRYVMAASAALTNDKYENGMPENVAVITGHLVRLFKLFDSLSWNAAENRGEIVQIFTRLILECHTTMKYLIKNGNPSFESFKKISYKSSIENYKSMLKKESERELIPIEKRIKRKIEARIKSDNLEINELFSIKTWKLDGKSFRAISAEIYGDELYHYGFGNSSSAVHGSWQDIELNQLERTGDLYHPKLEYDTTDPRHIIPMARICLESVEHYLEWSGFDPIGIVGVVCRDLKVLAIEFDNLHENNESQNL